MKNSPHITLLGDGNSVHVQRWLREMAARGWRLSLITARPAAAADLPAGVPQISLPPVRRSSDWLWRVGAARRALAQLQPDLVHAHYITSYGYLAARCNVQPLLMTAWGSDLLLTPRQSRLKRWLTAWALRRARCVTGDSADLLTAAQALAPQVPVQLIHWGVALERFAPTPWADKSGFEAVSLRSWEPNYRIGTILRALQQVRAAGVDARLHLLGGGGQEGALRQLAAELGLPDGEALHWHGRLSDAGMAAVLARCKLSISVPVSDATSVSVLESMACGLALLASDLPANRDWLPPAALLPATSEDALTQALAARWLQLAQHPAQAEQQAHANAQRMAQQGSRRTQMDAVDALYRRLLAQG